MTAVRSAAATAEVDAPAGEVFAFLADLHNHWRLAGPWIEVVAVTATDARADRATIRLRGPLGMVFPVATQIDEVREPHTIKGRGACGGSHGQVIWSLADAESGSTRVSVDVRLQRAAVHHRAIWLAGGRAWLARRLAQTVSGLDRDLAAHAAVSPLRAAVLPARA